LIDPDQLDAASCAWTRDKHGSLTACLSEQGRRAFCPDRLAFPSDRWPMIIEMMSSHEKSRAVKE
jgi:hypothetical protein